MENNATCTDLSVLESYAFFLRNPHLSADMLDKETRKDYYSLLGQNLDAEGKDGRELKKIIAETDKEILAELVEFFEEFDDDNETILEKLFDSGKTKVTLDELKKSGFKGVFEKNKAVENCGNYSIKILKGRFKTTFEIFEN